MNKLEMRRNSCKETFRGGLRYEALYFDLDGINKAKMPWTYRSHCGVAQYHGYLLAW